MYKKCTYYVYLSLVFIGTNGGGFGLQTSDSVTLDLLTYADLELLRNRKAGVVSRPRSSQQPSALTAKRYLILIYTVEFDRSALNSSGGRVGHRPVLTCLDLSCVCRIHYPLPLPYLGKPDPAALQKEIRTLRAELSAVASHGVNRSAELEIQRLRTE